MKPSCVCVLGGGGGGLVLNEFTTDKLKLDYYSSVGKRITPGNARPCITSRVLFKPEFFTGFFCCYQVDTIVAARVLPSVIKCFIIWSLKYMLL